MSDRYFDFPLTRCASGQASHQIPIPLEDIRKVPHLSRAVTGVFETFGEDACKMFSLSDRFRVYIEQRNDGQKQLFPDLLRIPEELRRTAEELRVNLERENPQPLAVALTSHNMLPLLRAVVNKDPKATAVPTYSDENGTHEIPVLEPMYFVDPTREKDRSRKGAFPLSGINFHKSRGYSINLTADSIEVVIEDDLVGTLLDLTVSSLCEGLWLEGTIVPLSDGRWCALSGSRIVHQVST